MESRAHRRLTHAHDDLERPQRTAGPTPKPVGGSRFSGYATSAVVVRMVACRWRCSYSIGGRCPIEECSPVVLYLWTQRARAEPLPVGVDVGADHLSRWSSSASHEAVAKTTDVAGAEVGSPGEAHRFGDEIMAMILWIVAVVLVISGVVALVRRQILWGAVLIIVGLLVGPGGVSIFT